MSRNEDEEEEIRLAALKDAQSIFLARQRAERELIEIREALERKTRELAQQREWFRVTLSSIGDAVIVTDNTGAVSFVNPVAERLTGWSADEAVGRQFTEVLPIFNERTGSPAQNPVERVLREGVVVETENHTILRSRTGRDIPIADSAAPIFGEDGEIRGVILVFHDVTEKHARERELREAEWRARTALEVGNGGAWVIEIARGVIIGDAMVARSFNVPAERCHAGEPLASFIAAIHADDREGAKAGGRPFPGDRGALQGGMPHHRRGWRAALARCPGPPGIERRRPAGAGGRRGAGHDRPQTGRGGAARSQGESGGGLSRQGQLPRCPLP